MKRYLPFIFLVIINLLFFYKVILYGQIPFPGDILASEYKPWSSYSYLGYNPGSIPSKAQYFDTAKQLYPWRKLAIDELKNGRLPLWNPYNFSGHPLAANIQTAAWYPFNIIFFILPFNIAWTILVMIQPLLASIFTYLFARRLKISSPAAMASSISFGYGLFMSVFLEYNTIGHVIMYLPLALYSLESWIAGKKTKYLILGSASIIFSGLAGHIQLYFWLMLGMFVYIFFKYISSDNKKSLLIFSAVCIFSLFATSIQLVPAFELINLSARSNHSFDYLINTLLVQPKQILMYFTPDIFGNPATRNYSLTDSYSSKALYLGLIPLFFALAAMSNLKKNQYIKFFTICFFGLFVTLVKSPLTEIIYNLKLPLISSSSPSNSIFLLTFILAILAGFGFDIILTNYKKIPKQVFYIFLFFLFVLSIPRIFSWEININGLYISLIFLGTILSMYLMKVNIYLKKIIVILISFVIIFDLFYYFHKFNPFVNNALTYPQTEIGKWLKNNQQLSRFWGYGTANIEANFSTALNLYSPDGYDPIYPKVYGELVLSSANGILPNDFTNQTRSDAKIVPGYGESDLNENVYRKKILDLTGVKYVLDRIENNSTANTFHPKKYSLVASLDDWKIFENLSALPRFKLYDEFEIYKDKQDFENILFSSNYNLGGKILIDSIPKNQYFKSDNQAVIRVDSYKPGEISLHTDSESNKILFLSDTNISGWNAYIDDIEAPIINAYHAYMAIEIPDGIHDIYIIYKPKSFTSGVTISIISMLFLSSIFLFAYYKYEKKN
ncbi:YfhO family protein [Patescibacteria group bacterium]